MGTFHTNHNEDFFITREIGDDKLLIAVMDGCSMGTESHFASTLTGKLLKKTAKELHYKDFIQSQSETLSEILQSVAQSLFEDLRDIKNRLLLEREELLNTLILAIVNHDNKTAEVLTIGDGLISYNHSLTEYEQDDKPDYLGYHLTEEFQTWYSNQNQRVSLSEVESLSIVTDGIFTFNPYDQKQYELVDESVIIDYLLHNPRGIQNEYLLKKRLIEIERNWGLRPSDDLTIITVKTD
jgi:hypothetical protein